MSQRAQLPMPCHVIHGQSGQCITADLPMVVLLSRHLLCRHTSFGEKTGSRSWPTECVSALIPEKHVVCEICVDFFAYSTWKTAFFFTMFSPGFRYSFHYSFRNSPSMRGGI